MNNTFLSQLAEANRLGVNKIPFVFFIDFKKDTFLIFTEEEINTNAEILVDFNNFKNYHQPNIPSSGADAKFEVFPETFEDYKTKYDRIREKLISREIELINFTRKTEVETNLSLKDIFYLASAKYKTYYKDEWVCFSPETFIKIEDGKIFTYPMKGTIDANLPEAEKQLLENPKEMEEHKKAVDLLIADLSSVAENIEITDYRRVDHLKTNRKNLLTTSSEIVGKIKDDYKNKIGSILNQLLPGGSILGHPREKALEIILEVEGYDRGFYSGICGYFDGENLDSGVMIRFIQKENDRLYFKSGGGVTEKSVAKQEYEEVIQKIYVPIH